MIELQHLTKRFATQGGTVVALNDINLTIRDGDVYGIIGMSGAGKSTLVRCINMLERPSRGRVLLDGQDLVSLSTTARTREMSSSMASRCRTCAPPTCARPGVRSP